MSYLKKFFNIDETGKQLSGLTPVQKQEIGKRYKEILYFIKVLDGVSSTSTLESLIKKYSNPSQLVDAIIINALANALNININIEIFLANGEYYNNIYVQPFTKISSLTINIANFNNEQFFSDVSELKVSEPHTVDLSPEHVRQAVDINEFIKKASEQGYQLINVSGDGHCFYHAVSHQLKHLPDSGAKKLHAMAINHMLTHPDLYLNFFLGVDPNEQNIKLQSLYTCSP